MSEYIVRMPNDMPYEIKAELNAWYVEDGPIVRCRDCKHFLADELGEVCGLFEFEMIDGKMADGFCKWGERKDESLIEFIEREGRKRDAND